MTDFNLVHTGGDTVNYLSTSLAAGNKVSVRTVFRSEDRAFLVVKVEGVLEQYFDVYFNDEEECSTGFIDGYVQFENFEVRIGKCTSVMRVFEIIVHEATHIAQWSKWTSAASVAVAIETQAYITQRVSAALFTHFMTFCNRIGSNNVEQTTTEE
jgi:hypothetical protein